MQLWPSPQLLPDPQPDPYSAQITEEQSPVLRTDVGDVNPGYPVQRSRTASSYKTISVQWMMSQAEYLYFQFFFENLISGGADWFNMPINITGGQQDFSTSDFSSSDFAEREVVMVRFSGATFTSDFNQPFWKVVANLEYEDTAA